MSLTERLRQAKQPEPPKQPEPFVPEWLRRAREEAGGRRFVAVKEVRP